MSLPVCTRPGAIATLSAIPCLQAGIVAFIVGTVFLRTQLHPNSQDQAQSYAAMLFFSLLQMFFDGIAEMTFTVSAWLLSLVPGYICRGLHHDKVAAFLSGQPSPVAPVCILLLSSCSNRPGVLAPAVPSALCCQPRSVAAGQHNGPAK